MTHIYNTTVQSLFDNAYEYLQRMFESNYVGSSKLRHSAETLREFWPLLHEYFGDDKTLIVTGYVAMVATFVGTSRVALGNYTCLAPIILKTISYRCVSGGIWKHNGKRLKILDEQTLLNWQNPEHGHISFVLDMAVTTGELIRTQDGTEFRYQLRGHNNEEVY